VHDRPSINWTLPAPTPIPAGGLPWRSARWANHQKPDDFMRISMSRCLSTLPVLLIIASSVTAQTPATIDSSVKSSDPAKHAQLARRGGGLRAGPWHLNGQQLPSGVTASAIPSFEGYVRTGLDLHLLLENSVGVWRQQVATPASGGLIGGAGDVVNDYIVPQFTSVLFYPVTTPNDRLEPYIRGGIGFALGVQDPQSGGGSIAFTPGFGLTSGVGVEWRMTDALGLTLSGRYQWIRFFQEFGPQQTYQGPVMEAGVTYRFQFR
jgi:opacity protein-like surface antigen